MFAAGQLPSKPVWLEQVHGKDVLKLTGEPYASKRADASYSNTPGTVCAVMTADCLPVLFCNRAGTEVAAAHAGWRGLCAGVLEETVACFADKPENILAWLGPAIGPMLSRSARKCAMLLWQLRLLQTGHFVRQGKNITRISTPSPVSA
jgi:YfiH family protein